jgi:hypothetical protein
MKALLILIVLVAWVTALAFAPINALIAVSIVVGLFAIGLAAYDPDHIDYWDRL